MCGYCVEESILLMVISEERRCGRLPQKLRYPWEVGLIAQESSYLVHLLDGLEDEEFGEELVFTAHCRLLGLLASSKDQEAIMMLSEALIPRLLGHENTDLQQELFCRARRAVRELFPMHSWDWLFDAEQILSKPFYPGQQDIRTEDCANAIEFYIRWWLGGGYTCRRDWRRSRLFDRVFPVVFFSVNHLAQVRGEIDLFEQLYVSHPKCVPNFSARDLWLQRTVLGLLAEKAGIDYIVERFSPLYPPHAFYLFITNDEMRNNTGLAVSQIRKHVKKIGRLYYSMYADKYIQAIESWPERSFESIINGD